MVLSLVIFDGRDNVNRNRLSSATCYLVMPNMHFIRLDAKDLELEAKDKPPDGTVDVWRQRLTGWGRALCRRNERQPNAEGRNDESAVLETPLGGLIGIKAPLVKGAVSTGTEQERSQTRRLQCPLRSHAKSTSCGLTLPTFEAARRRIYLHPRLTRIPWHVWGCQTACLGDKIFVVGGLTNYRSTSEVMAYVVAEDRWQEWPSMCRERSFHALCTTEHGIYALGGEGKNGPIQYSCPRKAKHHCMFYQC
ncbi:unnamed protein product [Protopolystoma xenopodis]|uniref:Uncharacterized protein n=1 Tax=Protopolystoma xenopodis TaxID=117903 RepID=A0A448WX17_9PLAT|nr:unnamed protein product [Protopolystoma xenopodis]